MEVNNSVLEIVDQLIDDVSNQTNTNTLSTASSELYSDNIVYDDQNENRQNDNERGQLVTNIHPFVNNQTANEPILLKINQVNIDIDFVWKIQAIVNYKHPKRTFYTENGVGDVSIWDLVDDTGSINLVAFNLNSDIMSNKLVEGKSFEFTRLSIRTVDDNYKTLPHECQLIVTNTTDVHEIVLPFNYQLTYDFTHLNKIETIPLNSIIDVDVTVIRDYGITVGSTNNSTWRRRELHVSQDGINIRLTLWNDKAKIVQTSMVNMHIKIKNVKVSWYNGSRTLVTLGNTRLFII